MIDILEQYSCGIETIEFSIGSSLDDVAKSVESYKKRIGKAINNHEISLHGPFLDLCPCSFDHAIREVTMLRYNQCYEAAKQLGAKKIIFHSCYYPSVYYASIWRENSVKFFQEFMRDKDDSIAILVENVFEDGYEELVDLVKEINHKAVSICLDIGHVNCFSKHTIEEWIRACYPYIGHVHIHNNDGITDQHRGLNKGNIPMTKVLQLLEELCPNIDYTMEMNLPEEVSTSFTWYERRER